MTVDPKVFNVKDAVAALKHYPAEKVEDVSKVDAKADDAKADEKDETKKAA